MNNKKQRIYLDSNVFIAFIKSEIGKPFKLMYYEAEQFLYECKDKYALVLSDHALTEIRGAASYSKKDAVELLNNMEVAVEIIETSEKDALKAREFCRSGIHRADALHAALAINSKCNILLTFNKKDFRPVEKLIDVMEPAELIE